MLYLYQKENILLRGRVERLKQVNSSLRCDNRFLLNKLENEADKNELLNGKVFRLRTQIRSLKQERKGWRQRVKELKADIRDLDERLVNGNIWNSKMSAEKTEKLWQVEAAQREQQIKLPQLEKMVAAQRVELQRADKFVEWQKAETRIAKELIEKQKAELRDADEETVDQLQKQQCSIAVLKQQELALKQSKEL